MYVNKMVADFFASGIPGIFQMNIAILNMYDKKSDEGSNSVRMRHENSGASTVVEN